MSLKFKFFHVFVENEIVKFNLNFISPFSTSTVELNQQIALILQKIREIAFELVQRRDDNKRDRIKSIAEHLL